MTTARALKRSRLRRVISQARRAGMPAAERDARQGGGKYTKPSPKLRRKRRRRADVIARASRKANR